MWEITGAEFTKHDVHTASGISVRFPRVTRIRNDKDWETATSLPELHVSVANYFVPPPLCFSKSEYLVFKKGCRKMTKSPVFNKFYLLSICQHLGLWMYIVLF